MPEGKGKPIFQGLWRAPRDHEKMDKRSGVWRRILLSLLWNYCRSKKNNGLKTKDTEMFACFSSFLRMASCKWCKTEFGNPQLVCSFN